MPRYVFDIEVDDVFPDMSGLDLDNWEAARSYAVAIATTHLQEFDRTAPHRNVRVIIKNENGETLDVLRSESSLDETPDIHTDR